MPELPEVETIVRQLDRLLSGRILRGLQVRDPKLAHLEPLAGSLAGTRLGRIRRSGKRVILPLEDGEAVRGWLAVHLRMTGRLLLVEEGEPEPAPARLCLELDRGRLLFADTRRFGTVDWLTGPAELAPPGLDPFDPACTPAALAELARAARAPLKSWLLDQTRICGLGNIYVCEILHASRLSPWRAAGNLELAQWRLLHREMRRILRLAIKNCGTTFSDFQDSRGLEGSFGRMLQVYGRAGAACPRCGAIVQRETQAQRGSWWCPGCQE